MLEVEAANPDPFKPMLLKPDPAVEQAKRDYLWTLSHCHGNKSARAQHGEPFVGATPIDDTRLAKNLLPWASIDGRPERP